MLGVPRRREFEGGVFPYFHRRRDIELLKPSHTLSLRVRRFRGGRGGMGIPAAQSGADCTIRGRQLAVLLELIEAVASRPDDPIWRSAFLLQKRCRSEHILPYCSPFSLATQPHLGTTANRWWHPACAVRQRILGGASRGTGLFSCTLHLHSIASLVASPPMLPRCWAECLWPEKRVLVAPCAGGRRLAALVHRSRHFVARCFLQLSSPTLQASRLVGLLMTGGRAVARDRER